MNNNPHKGSPANNLTATFYPGGNDDYYIPVVAPVPQRSMHEVTGQIQEGIEHLNFNTRPDSASPGLPSPTNMDRRHFSGDQGYSRQDGHRQLSGAYGQAGSASRPDYGQQARASPRPSTRSPHPSPQPREDEPTFSPFPPIHDRPSTVPPGPEEREQTLDRARQTVLTSNDPEMQVTWAQDTLTFVDSAMENDGRLADTGHGRARTPQVERQLRIDAVSVLSFLADQHHPRAEFLRGMWLEFGKFGFECDKREAYRCYSRAALNGYARAEYRMGMQFESSNEIEKAIKHYNLGMEGQDAASFYRLGMMNLLGQHGQPQDIQKGLDYIRFSADNADENAPQGAYVYGMLYCRELPQVSIPDHFLPLDVSKAAFYIEKAAYLGFAKAQVKMGTAYELSQLNCQFDPVYSLHYNVLAARQGEPEAEMAISKWYLSGYEGVFQKNEGLAYEYAQRAAQAGFPTAEFALGYFNEVGIHVATNLSEAKVWYGKAAEHGNEDAKGRISGISRSKTLSRKDHDKVALAKINSTRARPGQRPERFGRGAAQASAQPSVVMPHVDNYIPATGADDYTSFNQNPFNNDQSQLSNPGYGNPQSAVSPMSSTGSGRPNYGNLNAIGRPTPQPNPYERSASTVSSMSSGFSGSYGSSAPSAGPGPTSIPPMNQPAYRQSPLPQGYRVSSGGLPSSPAPGRNNFSQANKPLPSPAPDIGFSAPPDYGGADRRRVASGPGPALGPGGAPMRPPVGSDPRSNRIGTPSQMGGGMANYSSAARPPRGESLPTRPGLNAPVATPTPPPANLGAKPPGPSAPGARKPGKGPATFEEMGVPHAKQDGDCIIM